MSYSKVVIIDYGSQLTQLIARRVREAGVYSEIQSCEKSVEEIEIGRASCRERVWQLV